MPEMEMVTITGIYCIENVLNNKKYIGQSVNIEERLRNHKNKLRRGVHHNVYLQRTYDKYGEEIFKSYVIEECNREQLSEKERFWISYYSTRTDGYNMTDGGDGYHLWDAPQEYRDKIRKMVKGEKNPNYGNHWTDEMKSNLSNRLKESGVHKGTNNSRATKIFCIETLKIFDLISDAAREYGVSDGAINHALKSQHFVCKTHHFALYDEQLYEYVSKNQTEYLKECYSKVNNQHKWYFDPETNMFMTKTDLLNKLYEKYDISKRKLSKIMNETFCIDGIQYELLN